MVSPRVSGERRAARIGLAASFLLLVIGSFPHVLTSVLAAPMQTDIGFSDEGLGLAIAAFWIALTVTSPAMGKIVDRWGWPKASLVGIGLSAISLIVLGAATQSYAWMVVGLAIGGVGLAACSPASNLAIVDEVPPRFHGQAFGIKQSAMPAVALVAGLSVPLIAVTFGWRWVFIASLVVVPAVLALSVPRLRSTSVRDWSRTRRGRPAHEPAPPLIVTEQVESWEPPDQHHSAPYVPLGWLALILGLGTMTLASLSAFATLTLVESGIALSTSGLIIACASGFALVARVGAGWWVDRRRTLSLSPIAAMIAASVIGLALLSTGQSALIIIGIAIALTSAWGWPPIFILFTVRSHAHAPGKSTGITAIGSGLGSASGPVLFGLIAGNLGYHWAWWVTTAIAAVTVVIILLINISSHRPSIDGSTGTKQPTRPSAIHRRHRL